MIIEARIAHPQQMFIVWLPFDRIFGEGMLSVFQGECVLKDIDQRLFARKMAFPIEQEIPKACVPCLRKPPCLANRRKGTIHVVRFKLLSSDPAEDFRWRMTAILTLLCKWKMEFAAVAAFVFLFGRAKASSD